jgi:hypothetical protein
MTNFALGRLALKVPLKKFVSTNLKIKDLILLKNRPGTCTLVLFIAMVYSIAYEAATYVSQSLPPWPNV